MNNNQFYEILGKAVNVFTEINFAMQLLDEYITTLQLSGVDCSELTMADMEEIKAEISFQYGLSKEELLAISKHILNRYPIKGGLRAIKNKF